MVRGENLFLDRNPYATVLANKVKNRQPCLNPASSPIPIPCTDYCGEIGGFMSRASPQSYPRSNKGPHTSLVEKTGVYSQPHQRSDLDRGRRGFQDLDIDVQEL